MGVNGIVIRQPDAVVESRGARAGCPVRCQEGWDIPFERTLFVAPGARWNWDLIDVGFALLGRWDAAAPLAGMLAGSVGTSAEQQRTRELIHDLRVPLYGTELLFVRRSEITQRLLEAWRAEADSGDGRLGFLRALYQVKPRLLALPRIWLVTASPPVERARVQPTPEERRSAMISIEVAPGQFIKCFASEEKKVRARLRQQRARHERK